MSLKIFYTIYIFFYLREKELFLIRVFCSFKASVFRANKCRQAK